MSQAQSIAAWVIRSRQSIRTCLGETVPLSVYVRPLWRGLTVLLLASVMIAVGIPAQATTSATSSISGAISAGPGVSIDRVSIVAFGSADDVTWGMATTSADGSYTLSNIPAGSYKIRINGGTSGGYDTWYGGPTREQATAVTVGEQQSLTGINAVLPLGATMSGKASVPEGFSLADSMIVVSADALDGGHTPGTVLFTLVDAQGNYLIKGLAPDSYRINFYPHRGEELLPVYYGSNTTRITVSGTENITAIDATLIRASAYSGKITLPAGADTTGLKVSARTEDNQVAGRGSIAADGSYRITFLHPGKYRIKVSAGTSGLVDQWYSDGTYDGSATRVSAPPEATAQGIDLTLTRSPLFVDVGSDNVFFNEISWLAARGVTGGYPDGTYRSVDVIHRDAMAAFLYRAAGRPEFIPPDSSPFSDVATTSPFYKEITWLKAQGITTGYGDGTFRPLGAINRDAMAAFLYRFAGTSCIRPQAEIPVFTDNPVGGQFHNEIKWMSCYDISTGYPDGSYRPGEPVRRDAMAAFLKRWSAGPGWDRME